jgi:hypothetical protein
LPSISKRYHHLGLPLAQGMTISPPALASANINNEATKNAAPIKTIIFGRE